MVVEGAAAGFEDEDLVAMGDLGVSPEKVAAGGMGTLWVHIGFLPVSHIFSAPGKSEFCSGADGLLEASAQIGNCPLLGGSVSGSWGRFIDQPCLAFERVVCWRCVFSEVWLLCRLFGSFVSLFIA